MKTQQSGANSETERENAGRDTDDTRRFSELKNRRVLEKHLSYLSPEVTKINSQEYQEEWKHCQQA